MEPLILACYALILAGIVWAVLSTIFGPSEDLDTRHISPEELIRQADPYQLRADLEGCTREEAKTLMMAEAYGASAEEAKAELDRQRADNA